jgi:colanic acid biosynthesis glycosyl transferase WcaI
MTSASRRQTERRHVESQARTDGSPHQPPGSRPLRIVLHDYSGHPFQMQLARTLASRGHDVLHLHSTTFQTPKSSLVRAASDPPSLVIDGVDLGEPFQKYSFARRLFQERRYGRLLAARLAEFRPDVVISTNAPLDSQATAQRWAEREGVAFVFWLQDIYSVAIERVLRRRLRALGGLVARRFVRLEHRLVGSSDAVVAITADFLPILETWGVNPSRVSVVENWAPLDEIAPLPKDNPWSREHGLADVPVLLYAGTIGLKHDPSILLELAKQLPEARVVVVSEGIGADWLRDHGRVVSNLQILPFQPFDRLSEVLATADVLLAILEPDAGVFSVPSKVLTSLAAGRAILGAIPLSNLAARTIQRAQAGTVVDPGDRDGFVRAGQSLMADRAAREASARSARRYAETNFDIETIADRFEQILRGALTTGSLSGQSRNSSAARSHRGPGVQEDGS